MAKAAQEASHYGRLQYFFVGWGSLLLLMAAAFFAARAAKYTKAQATIAEAAYNNLERPYVYLQPDNGGFATNDRKVSIKLTNFGKTPAVLDRIAGYLTLAVQNPFSDSTAPSITHIDNPVLADRTETKPFTVTRTGTPANGSEYWLCGIVWYHDTKGQHYWHEFCYKFDFKIMRFVRQASRMNRNGTGQYPGAA